MAQLSPLNWIFLYFLFWSFVFVMVGVNWWFSSLKYFFSVKLFIKLPINRWNW
uniref:ATP synthase F0 subunit 8 n=1 Tax=Pleuropoma jana TaxID=1882665 RepID=A0A1B2G3A3_9GAST|nr:ATP synthase F0 subunit 8 [Pleuropoma jana]